MGNFKPNSQIYWNGFYEAFNRRYGRPLSYRFSPHKRIKTIFLLLVLFMYSMKVVKINGPFRIQKRLDSLRFSSQNSPRIEHGLIYSVVCTLWRDYNDFCYEIPDRWILNEKSFFFSLSLLFLEIDISDL